MEANMFLLSTASPHFEQIIKKLKGTQTITTGSGNNQYIPEGTIGNRLEIKTFMFSSQWFSREGFLDLLDLLIEDALGNAFNSCEASENCCGSKRPTIATMESPVMTTALAQPNFMW